MCVRCSLSVLAVVVSAGCSSATAPAPPSPTVVPAGVNDTLWADIGRTCTPSSPVTRIARVRLDSAPALTHGPFRTVDDDWADIALQIPGGFAGVILENNLPVVFLVDTTQRQQALAGLQSRLSVPGGLGQATVRAARWNFAELAEWYRYFQIQIFQVRISFADIDEAKNRITFGAPDSTARVQMEQALGQFDVPCWLVAIQIQGYATTSTMRTQ